MTEAREIADTWTHAWLHESGKAARAIGDAHPDQVGPGFLLKATFLRDFDGEPARIGDIFLADVEATLMKDVVAAATDHTQYEIGIMYEGATTDVRDGFEVAEKRLVAFYEHVVERATEFLDDPTLVKKWKRNPDERLVVETIVAWARTRRDQFADGPDPVTGRYFPTDFEMAEFIGENAS